MIAFWTWLTAVVVGIALATWLAFPRAAGATPSRAPAPGRGRRALRSAMVGVVLPWSAGLVVLACFAAWMMAQGQFIGFAQVWLGFVKAWSAASAAFLLHRATRSLGPRDPAA